MKISIAYGVQDQAIDMIRALVDEAIMRNVDFNGAEYIIDRGEYTSIDDIGALDSAQVYVLYNDILKIIESSAPLIRLRRCGEALYGSRWQSDLARALGVGDRRVREWAAGERRTPSGVWTGIASLLQQRQADVSELLRELDK